MFVGEVYGTAVVKGAIGGWECCCSFSLVSDGSEVVRVEVVALSL